MMVDPALSLPLAWFLGGILVFAAMHKLRHRAEFGMTLEGYAMVPRSLIPIATVLLALIELLAAAALVIPTMMQLGAAMAALLFAAYGLAMAAAIMRGRAGIDCGCTFGNRSDPLGWMTIVRNIALTAAAACVALPTSRAPAWPDIVSSAIAGGALLRCTYSTRNITPELLWSGMGSGKC